MYDGFLYIPGGEPAECLNHQQYHELLKELPDGS